MTALFILGFVLLLLVDTFLIIYAAAAEKMALEVICFIAFLIIAIYLKGILEC